MIKLINWAISAWKAKVSTSSPMFLSFPLLFFCNSVPGYSPLTARQPPSSLFSLRVEHSGKIDCSRRLRRHGRMWRSRTEERGRCWPALDRLSPSEPVWPVCTVCSVVWCVGGKVRSGELSLTRSHPRLKAHVERGPHPLNLASSGKDWAHERWASGQALGSSRAWKKDHNQASSNLRRVPALPQLFQNVSFQSIWSILYSLLCLKQSQRKAMLCWSVASILKFDRKTGKRNGSKA